LLETENIYKNDNSGYKLINKKKYKYELLDESILTSYIVSCVDVTVIINRGIENMTLTKYNNYTQIYKLIQTSDSIFNQNGSIDSKVDYNYSTGPYFNLKKQLKTTSTQELLSTYFQYSPDLLGQMANMDKLVSSCRIGIPMIVEEKKELSKDWKKIKDLVFDLIMLNKGLVSKEMKESR